MLQKLFRPYQLSESAVMLSFGNATNSAITKNIRVVNEALKKNPFPGFLETVPAYTTLTVFYDLSQVAKSDLNGDTVFEKIAGHLDKLELVPLETEATKTVLIPVCYEGVHAPDMEEMTRHTGLTESEVIKLHSEPEYEVIMLGFMPGFPYLTGMDSRLQIARRATPRKRVPEGAVGIAGMQTGIYPFAAPGGWQLIGRTPMQLFNLLQDPPALLQQGCKVKFSPISSSEFERLIS